MCPRVRKSIFDILGSLHGLSVLDIFAGSGTTGISAIGNNRNYYLFDMNPKGKQIFDERVKASAPTSSSAPVPATLFESMESR